LSDEYKTVGKNIHGNKSAGNQKVVLDAITALPSANVDLDSFPRVLTSRS
jgi:hypothetical protein